MKRKIVLGGLLAVVAMVFCGCGQSTKDIVEENISEITKVYYVGENESVYATLSSGMREKEYIMDGKSGAVTEFALLSVYLKADNAKQVIEATVVIDGESFDVELEINGINHAYMVDLEKEFTGNEKVEVVCEDNMLNMENISQSFAIDYSQAIEIACDEYADEINDMKTFSGLNAEFYLRILDKNLNNFDELFWSFTILGVDEKSLSVVISTKDGSILAKS